MQYFTIEELCQSETAERLKINNTPTSEIKTNLKYFIEHILDPLRESGGSAIIVNSGYRCPILNKAVKGSKTSAHLTGGAVDIRPKNDKIEEFKKHVVEFFKGRMGDQIILEKSGDAVGIHVGLFNNSGKQRRQVFKIEA